MTSQSRRVAGILLLVLPTVMFGGVSILSLLIGERSSESKWGPWCTDQRMWYAEEPARGTPT